MQRQVDEVDEEEQPARKAKADGGGSNSGPGLAHGAPKGGGQALPAASQSFFGSRFGYDFSRVRVHTDDKAAEEADSLNARAFTTGSHIAFGTGEYRPGTEDGDTLLAHELAHVVQQRSAPSLREGSSSQTALENDADVSAGAAMSGRLIGAGTILSNAGRTVAPRLKSGLRLQKCSKYTPEEKKKLDEAKKILNSVPRGKEALAIQSKYKIGVTFAPAGSGTEYDPGSNTMRIDSSKSPAEIALSFVHEALHAERFHEGRWADPKKLSKDAYIKAEVEEEAEGTVKSIETKIELEGTTIDVSKTSFALEKEYRAAYKAAVDAAKAADPKLSADKLKAIGRAAGKKRVIKGFMDGEVKTSTSGETYVDFYGKRWEKAQ